MYRSHTCGELRIESVNSNVKLGGWIQKIRNLGGMTFIDLRDRYGITQLVFDMETKPGLCEQARKMGREFVISAEGTVSERSNKNPNIPTGDIEIIVNELWVLNKSEVPPFTIEEDTDGGDELRMKYRYIDLRRKNIWTKIEFRNKMAIEVRKYLGGKNFIEVETPVLIKSTPEGARDFVVPSRMNKGQFYALPQSPQVFKQLLMISGMDRYFQIVKCFRDEDLRADRQPEFTQIDCEMSFVEQNDVLNTFEGLAKHLFSVLLGINIKEQFLRMSYHDAIKYYGNDKPDLRFGMKFVELIDVAKGKDFVVFDSADYIGGICAHGCASWSRKQIDKLIDFVRKPQIGASGIIYVKYNEDGSFKSSIDKFFSQKDLAILADKFAASPGDLLLILAGEKDKTRTALSELRLEMGRKLELIKDNNFVPLWIVDFPLLEWNEESGRYNAMHHPFTSPKNEDIQLMESNPGDVRANAYDLVINGVEIGGGSIRIHDNVLQQRMFKTLGFSKEEAEDQFGFLMNAFKYGAPPHGGIAFGFDRWVALFAGLDSIRDVIAFPKNNSGRDIMIDSPSKLQNNQFNELNIRLIDNIK